MDDIRQKILSARKTVQPSDTANGDDLVSEPQSIAPRSNSPFGISDTKKYKPTPTRQNKQAPMWADGLLRSIGRCRERVVLAVRDAARQAERKGLNPTEDEIYVASSIRTAWNLNPSQLSKGLRQLAEQGDILSTCSRRGRHLRFTLATPDEGAE